MSEFTETPSVTRTVSTPCCGTDHTLRFTEYQHRGYPRKTDQRTACWNLRCDGCGETLKAWVSLRLRRENPDRTGWSTYAHLSGPTWWTDLRGEIVKPRTGVR